MAFLAAPVLHHRAMSRLANSNATVSKDAIGKGRLSLLGLGAAHSIVQVWLECKALCVLQAVIGLVSLSTVNASSFIRKGLSNGLMGDSLRKCFRRSQPCKYIHVLFIAFFKKFLLAFAYTCTNAKLHNCSSSQKQRCKLHISDRLFLGSIEAIPSFYFEPSWPLTSGESLGPST